MSRLKGNVSQRRMGTASQRHRSPASHMPTIAGPRVLIQSTGREMWKRRRITRLIYSYRLSAVRDRSNNFPPLVLGRPRAAVESYGAYPSTPRHAPAPCGRLRPGRVGRFFRRPLSRRARREHRLLCLDVPDRASLRRGAFRVPRAPQGTFVPARALGFCLRDRIPRRRDRVPLRTLLLRRSAGTYRGRARSLSPARVLRAARARGRGGRLGRTPPPARRLCGPDPRLDGHCPRPRRRLPGLLGVAGRRGLLRRAGEQLRRMAPLRRTRRGPAPHRRPVDGTPAPGLARQRGDLYRLLDGRGRLLGDRAPGPARDRPPRLPAYPPRIPARNKIVTISTIFSIQPQKWHQI